MKSIDKYVLVLVASLALLLAGCGGGSTVQKGDPAPTPVETAQANLKAAQDAVDMDGTDAEMLEDYQAVLAAADALVAALKADGQDYTAAAKTSGAAKAKVDELTKKVADAADKAKDAMTAKAKALYAGIGAPTENTSSATRRHAAFDSDGNLEVTFGLDVGGSANTEDLAKDKDAEVAANHEWNGSKYTATTDAGGMYEAVVYSNDMVTEGAKFTATYSLDTRPDADNNNTEHAIDTTATGVAARIASSRFDQNAGKKEFTLAANNERVLIAGSYHGVAGTYGCAPNTGAKCTATIAASGFTLTGGTWSFKPDDADARLKAAPADNYANYGWWMYKSADGTMEIASSFAIPKGSLEPASGLDALNGTATYKGGAAGQYAIQSATGGANDAGAFTADAMLEANFTDNAITGTINNFMGADGMARDWSVELKKAALAATGGISRTEADDTAWSIGGTAGADSGEWSGALYNAKSGDELPAYGSGTFYTEFGHDGKMVGAFGVNCTNCTKE